MGQGINTKVAQVVAAGLGLPDLSLIKVRSANTFVGNNNIVTGGSQGSDYCCYVSAWFALLPFKQNYVIVQSFRLPRRPARSWWPK